MKDNFDFPNTKEFKALALQILMEIKQEILDKPSDVSTDGNWLDAVEECEYGLELSVRAFANHDSQWYDCAMVYKCDNEYQDAIKEIVKRICEKLEEIE